MTSIYDVDIDTYCGRVGNLYVRHGLCPPFELRRIAADWIAAGIAISHIVAVIDRHLTDHPHRYHSGSGDALFNSVDEIIRKTWYDRYVSPPQAKPARRPTQLIAGREWGGLQSRADHEVRSLRSPALREVPVGNRPDVPERGRADQGASRGAMSIGQLRRGPKRIDQAMAFLRRELADAEIAAKLLEDRGRAIGISPRTLDRARARLNVRCRRTGFAKTGKSWLSLPTTP